VIPSTRRRFLSLASQSLTGFLLGGFTGCSFSEPEMSPAGKQASLRLDWIVVGKHSPYFLGKDLGYYEAEGIRLEIEGGKGSGNTAQLVAAGTHLFGYLDAGILMRSVQEGAPLKSIMTIKQSSPFCVVSLRKTGIGSPVDLEGKTLAATTGVNDPILSLLPAVMEKNGADFSKVTVVHAASQAKEGLVLSGRADAMTASTTAQPPALEAQGYDIEVLSFSEWGVNPISNVMVAHTQTLRDDPELVRGFLRATTRSVEAARARPEEAISALMNAHPEINLQVASLQLQWLFKLIQAEQAGSVFGFQTNKQWEDLQALQIQFLGLKEEWDVSQYFTNDFLPGPDVPATPAS